jgi:hypothetical protein
LETFSAKIAGTPEPSISSTSAAISLAGGSLLSVVSELRAVPTISNPYARAKYPNVSCEVTSLRLSSGSLPTSVRMKASSSVSSAA